MKSIASLKTKLGTITVSKSGYTAEGYPGFIFSVIRDGKLTDIALVEVDENTYEDMPEPTLKVHVWAPGHEDPVFDQWLTAEQIDRMNEEGK